MLKDTEKPACGGRWVPAAGVISSDREVSGPLVAGPKSQPCYLFYLAKGRIEREAVTSAVGQWKGSAISGKEWAAAPRIEERLASHCLLTSWGLSREGKREKSRVSKTEPDSEGGADPTLQSS